MYTKIPAITGDQLIEILEKDGWIAVRKTTHGISLYKDFGAIKKLTIIRKGNSPIASGTRAVILSPKQTGIGKKGLLSLLNKYGL